MIELLNILVICYLQSAEMWKLLICQKYKGLRPKTLICLQVAKASKTQISILYNSSLSFTICSKQQA